MEAVLTVSEVARVLRVLEGRYALTPRGIRYYARAGMVVPSRRLLKEKRARATRIYNATDVALLRLVCRLHRQRVHERALWGLLVYRGAEVRSRIEQGRGEIVIDTPAELAAIGAREFRTPKVIRVDIATLTNGLEARLVAYRARHPQLWTGLSWMDAAEAAQQAAL